MKQEAYLVTKLKCFYNKMTNINKNNSEHQTIYSKGQPKYRIVITLPSANLRLSFK